MVEIACIDLSNRIGYRGDLLFHNKKDMAIFKELTQDSVVIMGKKTWDSLPVKPLKNRINIVLTSSASEYNNKGRGVRFFDSKNEVLKYIKARHPDKRVFIIGGQSIYELFMNDCDAAIITQVKDDDKLGDTFFPMDIYNITKWRKEYNIDCKFFMDNKSGKLFHWNIGLYNNITKESTIDFEETKKRIEGVLENYEKYKSR